MRHLRMLASLALLGTLLGMPSLAQGQAEDTSTPGDTPLALAPDGRLPLLGTPWRLRGYRWRGVDREPGPEVAAWMRLGPGLVEGSGGCTRIRGPQGSVGSAIRFDLRTGADGKLTCAEQTSMVQLGMVDGMRKATSYEIVAGATPYGDTLVLRSASGREVLRFGLDEAGELESGEWRLASYTVGGETVAADPTQPAVLTFRAERDNDARRSSSGPITGSTGCNGLVAEYFRDADVLSFSQIERTDAPCTPTLTAQEDAILSVLDATALSLALPPDRLVLTAVEGGDSLELVSSRPLEGSTWLLTKLAGAERPSEAVTLRLRGGVAAGEGPCGPYSASYASDGYFITFADPEAPATESCSTPEAQSALLGALRDAVMLDRRGGQLRLLDARGKLTARFKAPTGP